MELVLLSLNRKEFLDLAKRSEAGEATAIDAIGRLWDDHRHKAIACFLCDEAVDTTVPIFSMILPEHNDNQLIAAPLCTRCRDLPPMLRWSRSLRVLQKVHSARTGKNIRFHFNQSRRPSHPT
jgi:hypothetical protein